MRKVGNHCWHKHKGGHFLALHYVLAGPFFGTPLGQCAGSYPSISMWPYAYSKIYIICMLVQPRNWGARYGNQIQDVAILVIGDQLSTAVHRRVSGRGGLVVLGAHVPAHCGGWCSLFPHLGISGAQTTRGRKILLILASFAPQLQWATTRWRAFESRMDPVVNDFGNPLPTSSQIISTHHSDNPQSTSINIHFARLFHAFPMFSLGFSRLFLGISQPINPHALHRSPHQRLLGLLQLRCGAGDFEGALHLQHFDLGAGDLRHRSPTGTGERVNAVMVIVF